MFAAHPSRPVRRLSNSRRSPLTHLAPFAAAAPQDSGSRLRDWEKALAGAELKPGDRLYALARKRQDDLRRQQAQHQRDAATVRLARCV